MIDPRTTVVLTCVKCGEKHTVDVTAEVAAIRQLAIAAVEALPVLGCDWPDDEPSMLDKDAVLAAITEARQR